MTSSNFPLPKSNTVLVFTGVIALPTQTNRTMNRKSLKITIDLHLFDPLFQKIGPMAHDPCFLRNMFSLAVFFVAPAEFLQPHIFSFVRILWCLLSVTTNPIGSMRPVGSQERMDQRLGSVGYKLLRNGIYWA